MDQDRIRNCAVWLNTFFNENGKLQPRRVVKGEALKAGFGQTELKQARKLLKVKLMQNFKLNPAGTEMEDYWWLQ